MRKIHKPKRLEEAIEGRGAFGPDAFEDFSAKRGKKMKSTQTGRFVGGLEVNQSNRPKTLMDSAAQCLVAPDPTFISASLCNRQNDLNGQLNRLLERLVQVSDRLFGQLESKNIENNSVPQSGMLGHLEWNIMHSQAIADQIAAQVNRLEML